MIHEISKSLREFLLRGDALTMAVAFLVALAVYSFLQTLAEGLIGPAIAALFGKPDIFLLNFTINGSRFPYGTVLVGLILLASVLVLVAVAGKVHQDAKGS